MTQTTFLSDDEMRTLVAQVRTAGRWTNTAIQTRLKTRPDSRPVVPPMVTALARGGSLSQALANTLTQLPHLMREALAAEPSRPWAQLLAHNTRALQSEIDAMMTALTQTAIGRAKLRGVFELAATAWRDEATALEQTLAGEAACLQHVQRAHRDLVRELQGNRFGWLAFLINLFRGDAFTRLVEICNEREALALEMDVHQAATALMAQAANAAQQRAVLLAAKVESLGQAEERVRVELEALQTRVQSKLPFLTQCADNWRVTNEYAHAQNDGAIPQSLVSGLAEVALPAAASIESVRLEAKRRASAQTQSLNALTAFEQEAKHLGVPLEDETQNPLLLVGEALLRECLEAQPRFWLTALAHPREFLFQVAPDSAAPFELADSHIAKFEGEQGMTGYWGFVHVQLGLAREDLEAYAQTRAAFQTAQNDHNLFVIDELAKQWNRRWRKRERRAASAQKAAPVKHES